MQIWFPKRYKNNQRRRGEETVHISIERQGEYNTIQIGGAVVDNVKDYKIISSADGSTELIIHIKTNSDTIRCDLLTTTK